MSQTGPVTTYFAVILKPVESRDLSLPLLQKHAQHLAELDERYRPFADQLRVLAKGYQSKAILSLVERHLERSSAS